MERYEVIGEMASGGQGTICEVVCKRTNMHYVMKVYEKQHLEARREMEMLTMSLSENVPFFVDYWEEDEQIFIVMEKVDGMTLKAYMRKHGVQNEVTTLHFLIEIAKTIQCFHQHVPCLVYCDLKPENIMVTPKGGIKLIDFGSVISPAERGMAMTGTKPYTPEDEMCSLPYRDTYALGVIAYEMLTGMPFDRQMDFVKANIHHVDQSLRDVIQRAVSQRKENGFEDMTAMYEALLKVDLSKNQKSGFWQKYLGGKRRERKKKEDNYFIMDCKRLYKSGLICVFGCLLLGGALYDRWDSHGQSEARKNNSHVVTLHTEAVTMTEICCDQVTMNQKEVTSNQAIPYHPETTINQEKNSNQKKNDEQITSQEQNIIIDGTEKCTKKQSPPQDSHGRYILVKSN